MQIALFILPALQDYSMEYTTVCIQSVMLVNFRLFTFYLLVKRNDSMDNLLHIFLCAGENFTKYISIHEIYCLMYVQLLGNTALLSL